MRIENVLFSKLIKNWQADSQSSILNIKWFYLYFESCQGHGYYNMTNAYTFDEGQQQLFVYHTLFLLLVSFLFSQMYGKTHSVTKSCQF